MAIDFEYDASHLAESSISNNDYDPYAHRRVKHPISNFGACITVIKAMLGIGALAMPMAFCNAGWAAAILGAFVVGFVVIYALQILMRDMYEICKRERVPSLTYPEALSLGFLRGPAVFRCCSRCMKCLLEYLLLTYHFNICAVYVVFLADLMNNLVSHFYMDAGNRIYMSVLFVPLLMVFFIQDLRYLVRISFVANLFIFTGIGVVIYYVFYDGLKEFEDLLPMQTDVKYNSLYLGTTLFGMSAVGVIVVVEGRMKTPASLTPLYGVLNVSIFIVWLITVIVGFLGYLRFGDEIASNVLLNLPPNDILSIVIKVLVAIAILFTFPLHGFVSFDIVWSRNLSANYAEENQLLGDLLVRYSIIMSSVMLALLIPDLTIIISFGCLNLTMISMVFPALLRIAVFYEIGYGRCKRRLIEALLLLIIGIASGTAATYVSVVEVYSDFSRA